LAVDFATIKTDKHTGEAIERQAGLVYRRRGWLLGRVTNSSLVGQEGDERLELTPTSRLIREARYMTSDHRVAGSSPAGCKASVRADLRQSTPQKLTSDKRLLAKVLPLLTRFPHARQRSASTRCPVIAGTLIWTTIFLGR